MLELHIKKKYEDFSMDISFTSREGCLGILGASGSGKSMTLKCIAGIERPDYGYIILNDRVLFDSERRINLIPQKRNAGYLFQSYALFPNMTVEENIAAAILDKKDRATEVEKQIQRFRLDGLNKRYPSQLSGGQQQRTALARIMAQKPDIILLDEPFSALDGYMKEKLQHEMIQALREYNNDVLLVSHSRDDIYRFCNSLVTIDQGSMLQQGSVKDIFMHPISYKTARLTGCNNITEVNKIGKYEIYTRDWGIALKTEVPVSEKIKYVGIRAHDIMPSPKDMENSFPMELVDMVESPFEFKYHIKVKGLNAAKSIWWKTYKDLKENSNPHTFPCQLIIPKEKLLLLTE